MMLDLVQLDRELACSLDGVFTDIDDTLTSDGHLRATAYSALEQLQASGLKVIPVTGRPAGWCDHFARMWPVDAIVGENGAFYFRYDHLERKMYKRYLDDPARLKSNRARLDALGVAILEHVPGTALSTDQAYRDADLAIDFCEDVPALDASEVARIVTLFEAAGANAKISSIHVNGWFGDYDKLSMTRLLMSECYQIELDDHRQRYLFVGDSPNDAPMFDYFPSAVGVANVHDCADAIDSLPKFVTKARGGEGFVELTQRLLMLRRT
jgi:HAD superfamily hydrolase (TIGR01484 family)